MLPLCLPGPRYLLLWVTLFNLCVSSTVAAAGVRIVICYDMGSVGTCQAVTVQNYTDLTGTTSEQPSEVSWNLSLDYQAKNNTQPLEQDNGGSDYSSDDNDENPKKRNGSFADLSGQYFVVQVLVRLLRGIRTLWERFTILKPNPILFPVLEDDTGTSLYQVDGSLNTPCSCISHIPPPVIEPEMVSAELVQASWQTHDNETPSSLEFSLIPSGNQQAYALVNIPVYIQFTDWNDLDQQQSYWIDHPGELLELIGASWVSLSSSQERGSINCRVQVEEATLPGQVNLQCQLGEASLPGSLARLKESIAMIMAITPGEAPNLDPKEALDRVLMAPKGKQKSSQPKEKATDTATSGKGKKRLQQARFVVSPVSGGSWEEGPDEEQDPISKISPSERSNPIERLVRQLRKNIYKNIVSRFLKVGKSRDSLAQVLFDLYSMLKSPVWTVSAEQRSFLQWFREVQSSAIVGMSQKNKYVLSSVDFLSIEALKKKIKRWDENKVAYLTIDSLAQEFAAALLDDRSTTLLLIKVMNKSKACTHPLPLETMQEIEQFITPTEATGPLFPDSMSSTPAPVRPLRRDFSGSLPSLVQHRIQPPKDTVSALPKESYFERYLSLPRQASAPSRHHIAPTGQTTTPVSSEYFSQLPSTSTSIGYSSDSSGSESQQSCPSTSSKSSATPAQLKSLPRVIPGQASTHWKKPSPQPSPYRLQRQQISRPFTSSTLPRELENSLQSYRQLATALTEDQLVSLANAIRLDPRPYQSSDTALLRDARHGDSRIMQLMIQYIEYHSRSGSSWAGLDMLLEQVRRVLPGLITDAHGRIEWESMQLGASETLL